ncbi:hypothetical protein BCR33DRAFT_683399 [Rhizoclosmatium globosum]|uniref:cystathionine gamma-lyase n=1 Tax=Rhizoclosmatium globosum TaxID=329046 RepID=A0A1Y2BRA4_9FUNG|nr:hypothetical protein BCR33DRAFT_683399 [Rhizoclosmatium globosum]|eukprot:ORY36675.1 hypothetical protein BCR33DRAFT_683399 [Rhizoclosmatium globosum]
MTIGGIDPKFSSDHFDTRAIHAGQLPDAQTGAVVPPLSLSTTFVQSSAGVHKGFDYSRTSNPTRINFETAISSLERGQFAVAFSSGCATTTAVANLVKSGSHIVCVADVYGGTFRYMTNVAANNGITVDFVDMADPSNISKHIRNNTKMVWIESPTNPTLRLQHQENALHVAKFLESHPLVDSVMFPGLPSHPQHQLALKQCKGFSGMLSFRIKDGTISKSNAFLTSLRLFCLAESLGAVESLAELPSVMTHASLTPEARAALGIDDGLIRLSVGVEDKEDLVRDLDQALRKAFQISSSSAPRVVSAVFAKSKL